MNNLDFEIDDLDTANPQKRALIWLISSALITLFLWQIPFGGYVLYPFTLLSTWFHEMGHGFAAMLIGGTFHKLLIFPNASGLAYHSGGVAFLRPLVSMGGLLGPPIAGALFIVAGRTPKASRYSLHFLSALIMLSSLIWVRSLFGWLMLMLLACGISLLAWRGEVWLQQLAVQFLGVQACISTYRQLDYLFTYQVVIGGQKMLSDTGQIAAHWLLPYWVWGLFIAGFSLILLFLSIRFAYRKA